MLHLLTHLIMQWVQALPEAWRAPLAWRPSAQKWVWWAGSPPLAPQCWHGQGGASWVQSFQWGPRAAWSSPWCPAHLQTSRFPDTRVRTRTLSVQSAQAQLKLTLPQQDMADRRVHVIVDWVSAVDHQAVYKLHGLGSLTSQLARNHNLTALSAALHDEPQHTVAGPGKEQKHFKFTFAEMCEDTEFTRTWALKSTAISFQNFDLKMKRTATICCFNPSQTNASVSSYEEDSPLWRTGRNPQNVDLNQRPTEADRSYSDSSSYLHRREKNWDCTQAQERAQIQSQF